MTPGERQRLDGMLDRESRQINRERNDSQRAGGHDYGNHYGWERDPRSNNDRYDGGRNHGSWTHQPSANGAPTAPPATTLANGRTRGTPAWMIPASAPATNVVAPLRAPSSGGRTSRR